MHARRVVIALPDMNRKDSAMAREVGRKLSCASVVAALTLLVVLAFASSAGAATRTVTFDDVMPDTRVLSEYEASHGVTFPGNAATRPVVKTYTGKAHSGDRVGVYSCDCGEDYSAPQLRGVVTRSATSVSVYVGYWEHPQYPNPGNTLRARIRAFNSDGELVDESGYVTVTAGAALTEQVTATAPPGQRIDYFDVTADAGDSGGEYLAIDDLSITTSDGALPADFTLNSGQTAVDVMTGTLVDVPVDLNRLNGSKGDISFAVNGLPTGMSASFNPNPVGGTTTRTMLTLSAAEGAAHSDQYSEITITATPAGAGSGDRARTITKQVRIREYCDRTLRADYLDARSEDCLVRRNGAWEATDTAVRVNGMVIRPAAQRPGDPDLRRAHQVGLLLHLRSGRRPAQRPRLRHQRSAVAQGASGQGGRPVLPQERQGRAHADAQARLLAVQLLRRDHHLHDVHDRQRSRRRLHRHVPEAGEDRRARSLAQGRRAEVDPGQHLVRRREGRASLRQDLRGRRRLRDQERRVRLPSRKRWWAEPADRRRRVPPEHRFRSRARSAHPDGHDRPVRRPAGGGRPGDHRERPGQGRPGRPVDRRDLRLSQGREPLRAR